MGMMPDALEKKGMRETPSKKKKKRKEKFIR